MVQSLFFRWGSCGSEKRCYSKSHSQKVTESGFEPCLSPDWNQMYWQPAVYLPRIWGSQEDGEHICFYFCTTTANTVAGTCGLAINLVKSMKIHLPTSLPPIPRKPGNVFLFILASDPVWSTVGTQRAIPLWTYIWMNGGYREWADGLEPVHECGMCPQGLFFWSCGGFLMARGLLWLPCVGFVAPQHMRS